MSTVTIELGTGLRSVYDRDAYTENEFRSDLEEVHRRTAIERAWIAEVGLQPYESDEAIIKAARQAELTRVGTGVGYIAIDRLSKWDISRSDPDHAFHYSPPFMRPKAFNAMESVARRWQDELGANRYLSITSLVRSKPYQEKLSLQDRKLTILDPDELSSHQVGLAWDWDACGLKEVDEQGHMRSVNPREPGFMPTLIKESRLVLRQLLREEASSGTLNFVEELPGTQQHCFHVCAHPLAL